MKLLSNELPMLWSICSNRKPDHARPSSLCFQAGKNRKRYFWILFLAFSQHQGLADSPAPQDVFSVRITSEKWVHTHLQVGMTREEVLKLVGRPSFEDTGSTGDWIMSYLLKDPPYPATETNAYAGFEVILENNRVIRVDTVLRSVQLSPGTAK